MATTASPLELRLKGCNYDLSARRLWEFTEMGQINPFKRAISDNHGLSPLIGIFNQTSTLPEGYPNLTLAEV